MPLGDFVALHKLFPPIEPQDGASRAASPQRPSQSPLAVPAPAAAAAAQADAVCTSGSDVVTVASSGLPSARASVADAPTSSPSWMAPSSVESPPAAVAPESSAFDADFVDEGFDPATSSVGTGSGGDSVRSAAPDVSAMTWGGVPPWVRQQRIRQRRQQAAAAAACEWDAVDDDAMGVRPVAAATRLAMPPRVSPAAVPLPPPRLRVPAPRPGSAAHSSVASPSGVDVGDGFVGQPGATPSARRGGVSSATPVAALPRVSSHAVPSESRAVAAAVNAAAAAPPHAARGPVPMSELLTDLVAHAVPSTSGGSSSTRRAPTAARDTGRGAGGIRALLERQARVRHCLFPRRARRDVALRLF